MKEEEEEEEEEVLVTENQSGLLPDSSIEIVAQNLSLVSLSLCYDAIYEVIHCSLILSVLINNMTSLSLPQGWVHIFQKNNKTIKLQLLQRL